jgi:hypothetical protein
MAHKKYILKYISKKVEREVKKHQKVMQRKENERRGRKAKTVHFYKALDDVLFNQGVF